MPSAIYEAALDYKDRLLRRDEAIARDMAGRWVQTMRGLEKEIDDLAATMARRRAQGLPVTAGYVYRTERYQQLLTQAYGQFRRYEIYASDLIAQNQSVFAKLGASNGISLLNMAEPGIAAALNQLNVSAVETAAGFVANGSPLRTLLQNAWPQAIEQTTTALVQGVALGYNPRRIAAMMRQGMNAGLNRSLVIARTETLRAYRHSSMAAWRESGVVVGFQRVATHDPRTCPACLFSEGAFIPFENDFAEHPQGRCVAIPVTRRQGSATWEYGPEWFEKQSKATQVSILGAGRWEAWKGGAFDLRDIPQQTANPIWGPSMRARGLRELLADANGGSQRDRWLQRLAGQAVPSVSPNTVDYLEATLEQMVDLPDVEKWLKARYSNITFDFADAHMDVILPTARQLDKLGKRYPQVMERLEYVGTYRGAGSPKHQFGQGIAHAHNDGTIIGLNPDYYGDPAKYRETLERALSTNWLDADGSIESVLTHEFGHMVENWLLSQSTKMSFMPYQAADGLGGVVSTVQLFNFKYSPTKKLSIYATTTNTVKTANSARSAANKVEGWAEGFAAIEHKPKADWPIYVKRLNTLLAEVADEDRWTMNITTINMLQGEERDDAIKRLAAMRKKLGLER